MFELIDVTYKDVIDIPSLKIKEGAVTALIGASGSGKTTVLRLLCKMISPTSGRILYRGEDLQTLDSVAHRRHVTMLSQNPAVWGGTIRENLMIGFEFQQREKPDDMVLNDMLTKLNLNKPLDNTVSTLSGGEKQRLALGRMLLLGPDVYLLDEPSSALDKQTEEQIISLLVDESRKKGKTLVMATHALPIAKAFADTVIEFSKGTAINEGRLS